jgi:hypothetical protein
MAREGRREVRDVKRLGALACAAFSTAFFSGCTGEGPSAPDMPVTSALAYLAPGEPAESLPFQMSANAQLLGQDFAPGFGPPSFGRSTFEGRCSLPSDFVIGFSFRGRALHLGRVEGAVEHCTQVDFQTGSAEVTDGVLTLTAANGDVLLATYVGSPGPDGLEEYVTFDGGSGRFEEATGTATAHPRCNRVTGVCDFPMSGVLAYDASAAAASP